MDFLSTSGTFLGSGHLPAILLDRHDHDHNLQRRLDQGSAILLLTTMIVSFLLLLLLLVCLSSLLSPTFTAWTKPSNPSIPVPWTFLLGHFPFL